MSNRLSDSATADFVAPPLEIVPLDSKSSRTASNSLSHGCLAAPEHHLFYGGSRTPIFRVVPDSTYPGMWRVVLPDGSLSDMANLTWAKDAAFVMADRGPPRRNQSLLRWRIGTAPGAAAGNSVEFQPLTEGL